jgi:hypothetical protein
MAITCCRRCLAKWHRIPEGQPLTPEQIDYIIAVLARWLSTIEESNPNEEGDLC